ncbi:YhcN/YlaJ family sporulation lipoprotein [Bacillus sp. FJAT-44742]|uniref:YhcN/YlaJ family sporulation lipoprotein n=1 Tax=Bacillus sp. FJAT-44742 TaxID=2014005 RepID=UPI000C237BB2|nr:YhcN/YlaJ family sporulation lipoprotein [Bacillus sp. FJAT-44742]
MKKGVLTAAVLSGCLMLGGCGQMFGGEAQPNPLQVHEPENHLNYVTDETQGDPQHFGMVRHKKNEEALEHTPKTTDYINRQQSAEGISQMLVKTTPVEEACVLVTNHHVLVAYDTERDDRDVVAQQTKMVAEAMVPYYYEVYITDNPAMMEDIERFQTVGPQTRDIQKILSQTIEDMVESTEQPPSTKYLDNRFDAEEDGELARTAPIQ